LTINPEITVTIASLKDADPDYAGVGAYLNLEGTVITQSNSIPINIALGSSNKP